EDGLLSQHIRRLRRVYEERHERVRRILLRDFGGCLTPLPSVGGLHLAALLEGEGDAASRDHALATRARAAGVSVLALSYHYVSLPPRAGLLIGYGAIESRRIDEALGRLRGAI